MAIYHRYNGVGNANNQLSAGIWGNPDDKPCPTTYVQQLEVLAKLTNKGLPRGVLSGSQPTLSGAFYDACYDWYAGVVPQPLTDVLSDVDVKTRQSAKAFRAAQAAGNIVLKPRTVSKFTVVRNAGFNIESAAYLGTVTRERALKLSTSVTGRPVCKGATPGNLRLHSIEGIPPGVPMVASAPSAGHLALAWHKLEVGEGSFYHPDWDDVMGLWSLVEAELSRPNDRGLITSAIAEANSGTFDLLTELGEMKETVSYIFGLLKSIIRLVVKTRRAAAKIPKQPGKSLGVIADELASVWMQFRYAVMPLTYSIDDAIDTIATIAGQYKTFRTGVASREHVSFNGWVSDDPFETIDRVYVKYRLDLEVALNGIKTNPFATAWELVPLSFVVDWVLNIGDMLSALYTPAEVIDSGFQYSRQVRPTTLTFRQPDYTGTIELHCGYYNSRPFIPLDHIGLQVDLEMTWKRWLDALSLSWLLTRSTLKNK